MAVIPHVVAGNTALAAEQNALIDQVNSNTSTVVTVGTGVFTETDTVSAWATAAQSTIDNHESRLDTIEAPPKCSVYVNTSGYQTLNYQTDTMILWESEALDTNSMFTPGGSGITVPVAGTYMSVTSINLATVSGTVTGALGVKLLRNTTDPAPGGTNEPNVLATNTAPFNVAGEGPVVNLSVPVYLSAGDVVRVSAWHNFAVSGTGQNIDVWRGFNAKGTKWDLVYLGK